VDQHKRLFVASANNGRLEVYGLDDYQDPETVAPALLNLEPNTLDRDALVDVVSVAVELPGRRLAEIQIDSLAINGIPAQSVSEADPDRDRNPDLVALVDAGALAQTLPPMGVSKVRVTAALSDGFQLEGSAPMSVFGGVFDADGDGIDDSIDLCPDTQAGAIINAAGCGLTQLCPCEGINGEPWAHQGEFIRCAVQGTRDFHKAGLAPRKELRQTLGSMIRSGCGRRPHQANKRGRWR
jgi:hypothetical protein